MVSADCAAKSDRSSVARRWNRSNTLRGLRTPLGRSSSAHASVRPAGQCGVRGRLWAWSPIRVHAESWSAPGTFTRTSSPACANTERTGICRRHRPGRELVAVSEAVYTGEVVISDVPPSGRSAACPDRPGIGEGLSDRTIDAGSRTQAVLWGVKHGSTPGQNRIEPWRGNSEVSTCRPTTPDRTYHPYR
jgi:hypothetical protein